MPTTPAAVLASRRIEFQSALLRWFDEHRRSLPWRERPSLYKTVVSEFMLQQTQVKTVLPYFARWMQNLPDFKTLAAAESGQVLKLWEGLGYYSRARNLHQLAKTVAALSAPPRSPVEWLTLPGVGPYTAAAITSIAFGAKAACVDGNVVRILARLTADATSFRDSATAAKFFRPLAEELLAQERPGDHNQAMMELGATVCHRNNPLCTICPVYDFCAGAKSGAPERFPQLAAKQIEAVSVTRVWLVRDGKLLLHRTPTNARRLAEMHELPRAIDIGIEEASLKAAAGIPLAVKKRAITRFSITETIHLVSDESLQNGLFAMEDKPELVWVPLKKIESLTLSGPHRRWIAEILIKTASN